MMINKNVISIRKYSILYFLILFYTAFDAFAYFGAINSLAKMILYFIFLFLMISFYRVHYKILFIFLILLFALVINCFVDFFSLTMNFKALIRIFNPFLIFIVFSHVSKKSNFFSADLFLKFFRVFYSSIYLSLFLGKLTGVGTKSIRFGMNNFEGFFKGANEIGILLIIILIYLYFLRSMISEIEFFFILCANILFGYFVFTKSAFMAIFFSFLYLNLHFKYIRRFGIIVFGSLVVLSLNIDTVLTKILREVLMKSEYIKVLSTSFIHFIFNSREIYFISFFNHFDLTFLSFLWLCFIGLGDYGVIQCILPGLSWIAESDIKVVGRASFEMDFFDLFFGYGFIFTLIYISCLYKYIKIVSHSGGVFVTILLFSIIGHSFLAGHVLFSTQITGPLMILYFFVTNNTHPLGMKCQ